MPPKRKRARRSSAIEAETSATVKSVNVPDWFRRSNVLSLVQRRIQTLFPENPGLVKNREFLEQYIEYFYKLYTERPTSKRHPNLGLSELQFATAPMSLEDIRQQFLNKILFLECRVDMTKDNFYHKMEKYSYKKLIGKNENYRKGENFPSFRKLSYYTLKYVNKYMKRFLDYLEKADCPRGKEQENNLAGSSTEMATGNKSSAAPLSVKMRRLQEDMENRMALTESQESVREGPRKRVRFQDSEDEDAERLREAGIAALYDLDTLPPEIREDCEIFLFGSEDPNAVSTPQPCPKKAKSSAVPLSVQLRRMEEEQQNNLSDQQKSVQSNRNATIESDVETEEDFTEYNQKAVEAFYSECYKLFDPETLAEVEKINQELHQQETVSPELNRQQSQRLPRAIDNEKEDRRMDITDSEDDFVFCNLPKKRKNLKNISNIAPSPKRKPRVVVKKKPKAAPLRVKIRWEAENAEAQGNQTQEVSSQTSNSSAINDNDGNNNSLSVDDCCITNEVLHSNSSTVRATNEDFIASAPLTGQGLSQERPERLISSTPNFAPDIFNIVLNNDRLLKIMHIHRDIRSYFDGGTDRIQVVYLNENDATVPSSDDNEAVENSGSPAKFGKDKTTQDLLESSSDSSDIESEISNHDRDIPTNTVPLLNLAAEIDICIEDGNTHEFKNPEQLIFIFLLGNLSEDNHDMVTSDSFPPRSEIICVEDLSERMSQLNTPRDPLHFTQ